MVARNEEEKAMGHSEYDPAAKDRRPWNVGRMVGAKRALKPQQVWAIRFWLDREGRPHEDREHRSLSGRRRRGCARPRRRHGGVVSDELLGRSVVEICATVRSAGSSPSKP